MWYKPCMWNICFWPKGYRNISMTINMQLYCKKHNLYQYHIKYQSRSSRKPSITSLNIFEHHLMSVLSGITFHAEDEQLSWPVCPSKGQCAPRTLCFCSVWSAWWMKKKPRREWGWGYVGIEANIHNYSETVWTGIGISQCMVHVFTEIVSELEQGPTQHRSTKKYAMLLPMPYLSIPSGYIIVRFGCK